jgi:hypothetical protein
MVGGYSEPIQQIAESGIDWTTWITSISGFLVALATFGTFWLKLRRARRRRSGSL